MKKLIIATSVLFAFSSVFSQKGKKNVEPTIPDSVQKTIVSKLARLGPDGKSKVNKPPTPPRPTNPNKTKLSAREIEKKD